MSAALVHVTVDPQLCMGSGTCIAVAPDLFEIGNGGTSEPRAATVARSDILTMAVTCCPTGAIQLVASPVDNC